MAAQITTITIIVIAVYITCMFILSQIFIPNLGYKRKIAEKIPLEAKKKVEEIKKNTNNKKELLEKIVSYQLTRFYSKRRQIYKQFPLLFEQSFEKLWLKKGLLHCHQQNYILRNLLLSTELFTEEDIKLKITFCYINIHQYLKINIGNKKNKKWINVDPFAMSTGKYKLGERLPRFA